MQFTNLMPRDPEVSQEKFHAFLTTYSPPHLLIVSNSAGTASSDPLGRKATLLSSATNVPVLHHATKKPGCGSQILEYFLNAKNSRVTAADQIAVVGDRLFTDVMTANLMGSWAVWIQDGVVVTRNPFTKWEQKLPGRLTKYGFKAPMPKPDA
ncbi:MAG: hypothetical protein LQ352_000178 [Teloschistes flavicans]|nr:MAG: hypothetical protein LQ352_000178 [Teloschistes flavicans]